MEPFSPEIYARMKKLGYIDDAGNITEKCHDDMVKAIAEMVEAQRERDANPSEERT